MKKQTAKRVTVAKAPTRQPTPCPTAAPEAPTLAAEMMAQLRRMGDPARARGAQQYFKHQIVALGITTPVLRQFVREQIQPLRRTWRLPEAIRLCDCLLQAPELEVRGAGFLALGAFAEALTPELLPSAKSWLEQRLDNWALVDGFCSLIVSPLLARHPETEAALREWSGAPGLWLRRAALVALVPFARRGQRLDLAYRLAQAHFGDPEDLMHKATGWLLREAGKTDPTRLETFLRRHGPRLPRTAVRYAIERFSAAKRAELLRATRGGDTQHRATSTGL